MIRKIQKKDYDEVYSLGELLHSNFRNQYHFDELLQQEYFKILVDEEEHKIVGFIMVTDLEDTMDIVDVVVNPSHRHQGIGSELLQYIITNIKPSTSIYLEVAVDNKNAIGLYQKMGFEMIHTR